MTKHYCSSTQCRLSRAPPTETRLLYLVWTVPIANVLSNITDDWPYMLAKVFSVAVMDPCGHVSFSHHVTERKGKAFQLLVTALCKSVPSHGGLLTEYLVPVFVVALDASF